MSLRQRGGEKGRRVTAGGKVLRKGFVSLPAARKGVMSGCRQRVINEGPRVTASLLFSSHLEEELEMSYIYLAN
jgi:hypothetical protein